MAATLDFHILCTRYVDFKMISKKYGAEIKSVAVIDDWQWKNQRAVSESEDIEDLLCAGKIIVVNFEKATYKDIGLYIEKNNDSFMYSLWVNTEGHSNLETDITNENVAEFCKNLIDSFKEGFKFMGVGVETTVKNDVSIEDIVKNSYGVVMWFISKNEKVRGSLKNYRKKIDDDLIIFTKK